jgi:hypothetical protein
MGFTWPAEVSLGLSLDFPQYRGQAAVSRRDAFKRLGTDTAEMTVTTGSIVEAFDVIEDVGSNCARCRLRVADLAADASMRKLGYASG